MKIHRFEVRYHIAPINILGSLEPREFVPTEESREVYLNDERVPPWLELVILRGLDNLMFEEVDRIHKVMRQTSARSEVYGLHMESQDDD